MRCVFRNRSYATQSGHGGSESLSPKRRSVTPFNDDGYVPWSELSAGEKTARATQQTFNFGFVLVGLALTVSFAHIPDAQLGREGHNSDQRTGRGWVFSVDGRLCTGQQNQPIQPGRRQDQEGSTMH